MMRLSKSCRGIQKRLKKTDFRQTERAFPNTGKCPQFVKKALLFHKLCPYFKWKRGLAPFSKPFSPCHLASF